MNCLINAAFKHLRMRCLLHFSLPKCGVYWRAAFKRRNTLTTASIGVSYFHDNARHYRKGLSVEIYWNLYRFNQDRMYLKFKIKYLPEVWLNNPRRKPRIGAEMKLLIVGADASEMLAHWRSKLKGGMVNWGTRSQGMSEWAWRVNDEIVEWAWRVNDEIVEWL